MKQTPEGVSPEALRGRALALLTRREHSRSELRRKLAESGGAAEDIEPLLEELAQRRLQSDGRFAESFIRSRAERGYGPRMIAADLKARGLDAEAVSQALAGSGYDWAEQAVAARQRRFGRDLPQEPREKARQMRFLQYRGFTGADIGLALRCEVAGED